MINTFIQPAPGLKCKFYVFVVYKTIRFYEIFDRDAGTLKGQVRGQFVFKRHLYGHSICVFFVRTLTFVGVGDQAIFLAFLLVAATCYYVTVKFGRLQVHSKNRRTCSGLLKTALNNVLLPALFNVVNNIVKEYRLQRETGRQEKA